MKTRNGFTLIEMLIVITMIGLLMTMITAALFRARLAVKKTRAEIQLRDLIAAWGEYYLIETRSDGDTYVAPPLPDGIESQANDSWGAVMDSDALKPLITPNAQGFVYLTLSASQLRNGKYLDPWGMPYRVKLNSATGDLAPPDLRIRASASFINRTRE